MPAYSYIRFSTKEQSAGDSFNRQIEASRKWCAQRGIELSEKTYADLGISAFKEKTRASLADMLSAIQLGSIKAGDHIILENLDRLSRQGIDITQEILRSILREGVKIVSLQDGLELDRNSLNDLVSVIRIAVSANLAHMESVKKSERVLAAKRAQREQVKQGKAVGKRLPYWLELADGQYQFNDRVDAIRLMVDMRIDGAGYGKIAIALNGSQHKPRTAEHWSVTTVKDILNSPALFGRHVFVDTDYVDDYYPALVSYTQFQTLKSTYTGNAGGRENHNHLYGLVRCGKCGSAMTKKIVKRGDKNYNVWCCVGNANASCKQSAIRDVDLHVIRSISRIKISDPKKANQELSRIDSEIDAKKARLSEITELMISGNGSVVVLNNAAAAITAELKALESTRMESIQTSQTDIQMLSDLTNSPEKFNVALRRIISRIVVNRVGKNTVRAKLFQRNGHLISITAFRKNQRSQWQYFFGNTAETAELANSVSQSDMELYSVTQDDGLPDDFDYELYEVS